MRSIETSFAFPLSAVKPLDRLLAYRSYCVDETKAAMASFIQAREACPACTGASELWHPIENLQYSRCIDCGTLFFRDMPTAASWADLLARVSERRNAPGMHISMAQSRMQNVYAPKLDWIQHTLRLQGIGRARLIEVTTPPSPFTQLLNEGLPFTTTESVAETDLMTSSLFTGSNPPADAAVLLESLDRAYDPAQLLNAVSPNLASGGLVFVTALVASGFDMTVLGPHNRYLYPPDRANCFTLDGLEKLLARCGYRAIELSTPGVLDLEIVAAHQKHVPGLELSAFEQQLLNSGEETRQAFQSLLQQNRMSSFARVVARKAS